MKIVKLEIKRRDSYEKFGTNDHKSPIGVVEMIGENGEVSVVLSHKTVGQIFQLCREDIKSISLRNAKDAAVSADSATHEINMLIENQELED